MSAGGQRTKWLANRSIRHRWKSPQAYRERARTTGCAACEHPQRTARTIPCLRWNALMRRTEWFARVSTFQCIRLLRRRRHAANTVCAECLMRLAGFTYSTRIHDSKNTVLSVGRFLCDLVADQAAL